MKSINVFLIRYCFKIVELKNYLYIISLWVTLTTANEKKEENRIHSDIFDSICVIECVFLSVTARFVSILNLCHIFINIFLLFFLAFAIDFSAFFFQFLSFCSRFCFTYDTHNTFTTRCLFENVVKSIYFLFFFLLLISITI